MMSVFDQIRWRDPVSGRPLEPIIEVRTPSGVPLTGALRVTGTDVGYPIVDSVARLTPEAAGQHQAWLERYALTPPDRDARFQEEETVESFGFQWTWNNQMRSEQDLAWRAAERFQVEPSFFCGRLVLDAGAGAGDQSRWFLERGASVLSVDLSSAIDVVSRKLRMNEAWFGIQADLGALPLADQQIQVVYCEGVIQHTRDSEATVRELCRVVVSDGHILATHYARPATLRGRAKHSLVTSVRRRLSRLDRYRLLFATGLLSALAHTPLIGRVFKTSGLATHSSLMPDFKTTWTNTFDTYGSHSFQRHVDSSTFAAMFERVPSVRTVSADGTVVHAIVGNSIR